MRMAYENLTHRVLSDYCFARVAVMPLLPRLRRRN